MFFETVVYIQLLKQSVWVLFVTAQEWSKLGPSRMLALKQPGTLLLSNFEHRIHCRMPFYLLGKNSIPQVKQKTEQHF